MQRLDNLIAKGEEWLINRVLQYAIERDYVKYTSTLREAWRASIAGLSQAFLTMLSECSGPCELGPDDDYQHNPVACFGVLEARRHRDRGISLQMFLGLMKYYRQAYLDLIQELPPDDFSSTQCTLLVNRFFDTVEVAFCSEWTQGETDGRRLTDLQSANISLANEKNKYLTIFESLPTPVFLLDEDGLPFNCNAAAQELLQVEPVPGRHYYGDNQELKLPKWLTKVLDNSAGAEMVDCCYSIDSEGTKGGRAYHVQHKSMLDSSKKFTGTVLILHDITERKEAERKLLKSKAEIVKHNEELKSLVRQVEISRKEWEGTMDCLGNIVILADNEGRIKRCNKALSQFTDQPMKHLLGCDWRDLLKKQGLEPSTTFASGMELYHKSSQRWFVFHSYPFTDTTGYHISGMVITIIDTTELKRTSEELGIAYNELKSTQMKILQQEKMASIGQLAAGVAHEINNPIGFVSSNLASLDKYLDRLTGFINRQTEVIAAAGMAMAEQELTEMRRKLKVDYIISDVKQLISESLEGTERVRAIVQNLRSFSRLDEKESRLSDLIECLESTINIIWNELKYKVTLRRDYDEIPRTRCYPQQLNQVFLNLLVNAAHSIDKQGEVSITVRRSENNILVAIADTGCGIPAENLGKIFDPFFTTKEVGKGTGLGLSISYDIIKKHGGEIMVQSEVGKGTVFTVKIPIVES